MHKRFVAVMTACALGHFAGEARAEIVGITFQGHAGYAGGESGQFMPGGEEPSLGPALGFQIGAHLMALDGYVDHTGFGRGGTITRAVIGMRGKIGWTKVRVVGHAGGGLIWESDGALASHDPMIESRSGLVARAGAALDYKVAKQIWLGLGLDGEYYAIAADPLIVDNLQTGSDLLGNLHLAFEFSL
jgi:hypothetical protein